ncbi:MAG: peptide deformylase [Zoogloeaceae bacterium]|jgi:peptide deformylase|nr:peptide deformylase [Zoogloeaceae bacterium]
MALFSILRFPDPRLRKIAAPVAQIDASVRALVADMAETMYAAPGIGLAATQVDVHQQIVVIDISEERNQLRVFVNPRITRRDGLQTHEEGCLSVPDIYEKVERAAAVRVEYLDLGGKPQTLDADGLLAVCIQHEIDHLQGKVFVDHLSQLKQARIRDKFAKRARKNAAKN